jgi:hypothetical protein
MRAEDRLGIGLKHEFKCWCFLGALLDGALRYATVPSRSDFMAKKKQIGLN